MATLVTNPYSGTSAIKQHHRNGCWAACLEWWSRCVLGCTGYTQDGIRKQSEIKALYKSNSATGQKYKTSATGYGTLETHELIAVLRKSPWHLSAAQENNFNGAVLQNRLTTGPVVIGYFDLSGNTWHVNVICAYDAELGLTAAMEPRSGKYLDKSLSDFTVQSPFHVLGWRT